ncbi:MAG: 3-isopropylmalate dehydratase large subunit [Paracoccaceae bacterium]
MSHTLMDKIWASHLIHKFEDGDDLLLIDRIFLHERTGAFALKSLETKKLSVKEPSSVFCTIDHIVDIKPGRPNLSRMPEGQGFIEAMRHSAKAHNLKLFDLDSPDQGIVHVISPELGIVQPGLSLICADSHTCTQGAFGALAWGVGTTDLEHALATKTLKLRKPKNMRINLKGKWLEGVNAKDAILAIISKYGASHGNGFAIEFAGPATEALCMEDRMTLCNMAVEFGAFTAIIKPDQKAISWLKNRRYSPDSDLAEIESYVASLFSDKEAVFDEEINFDVTSLKPYVSWGSSVDQSAPIDSLIPQVDGSEMPALNYMTLNVGTPLLGLKIDGAFIGSCTNGRLTDLRRAAAILKGKKVAPHVKAICVPGSSRVKAEAEKEGIDKIFINAGFEWCESGCGFCFYAGGETFEKGARVISSTNRNFEGRQGPQVKTHIAAPETVAASAVLGFITSKNQKEH